MKLNNLTKRNLSLTIFTIFLFLFLFTLSSYSQSCNENQIPMCTDSQIDNECSGCKSADQQYCCTDTMGCNADLSTICNPPCNENNICLMPQECTGTDIPNCMDQDIKDCSVCSENDFCCPSSSGGTAACDNTFSGLCNGNTCTDSNICKYVPPPPVLERDFTFINNCSETIWVGLLTNQFKGGFELTETCTIDSDCLNACPSIDGISDCTASCDSGKCRVKFTGNIDTATADSISGRAWPMTGCDFDASLQCTGKERCCDTGSCTISGGFGLQCNSSGDSPNTVAEFTLNSGANNDFYDVSVIDGYNVPIEMKPTGTTADPPLNFDTSYWCENPGGVNSTCKWGTTFGDNCVDNPDFRAVGSLQKCTDDSDCGSGNCNVSDGICECKQDTDCNVCLNSGFCSNDSSTSCTENSDCTSNADICGVPNPGFIGIKACGTLSGCTTAKDICGLYFGQGEKGDSCGQTLTCASEICLAPNTPQTCSMDSDCDAVCSGGTCANNSNISCTMDSECAANCVDGQCQKTCSVTSDCQGDAECADGVCQCIPNVCNSNGKCTRDNSACSMDSDCTPSACSGVCTEGPADFLSCNEIVSNNKNIACSVDSDCPAIVGLDPCTSNADCPTGTDCVNFGAKPAPGKPEIPKVCRQKCDSGFCSGPTCTTNSDCTGESNGVALKGTFMQCDTGLGKCVATYTSLFQGAGLTGQSCYIKYYDELVDPSLACNGCPTACSMPHCNPAQSANANWPTPSMPCLNTNTDWISVVEPYAESFKEACATAYSFPFDDPTSTFQCTNDTLSNSTAYQITFCPVQQISVPPFVIPRPVVEEETEKEPVMINPGNDGSLASIEFDPDLDGGGQILLGLPEGLLAVFAQLDPDIGDCEILSQTARVTDPDVICSVDDFPENLDVVIDFCKETDLTGIAEVAVEVFSDGKPDEDFSNFLEILFDEIESCSQENDDTDIESEDLTIVDATNGCSLAPEGKNSNNLLLFLLIPGLILFRRLKK